MKFTDYSKIQPGTLVTFNASPEATVFEVKERRGFAIMVVERGTNYAAQLADVCMCHVPCQGKPKKVAA